MTTGYQQIIEKNTRVDGSTRVLIGLIEKVKYFQANNGFSVIRFNVQSPFKGYIDAFGKFSSLKEMQSMRIVGKFVSNAGYKNNRFQIDSYEVIDNKYQILKYLTQIEGIGKYLSEKIYNRFGEKAIKILRDDPEKLYEISGIGSYNITPMLKAFRSSADFAHSLTDGSGTTNVLDKPETLDVVGQTNLFVESDKQDEVNTTPMGNENGKINTKLMTDSASELKKQLIGLKLDRTKLEIELLEKTPTMAEDAGEIDRRITALNLELVNLKIELLELTDGTDS